MTAIKTSFLNAVGLFSLFLNKENGMIHKIFSPIKPIVHCIEIPYLLLLWFPSHQNVLGLCIGGVDKKETYKPQHDSVNYSFNVDTRNLCNVSQQASNQATWKQILLWGLQYSINRTPCQHTAMFYRKNKSKTRTMQTKGLSIQYMAYSSEKIFFPWWSVQKNSCISSS